MIRQPGNDTEAGERRASGSEQFDVLMLPDYTDANPYQHLLASGFEGDDVAVTLTKPADARLPLLTTVAAADDLDVLHLHFLSQFVLASPDELPDWLVAPASVLLTLRFFAEVALLRARGVSVVWTVHDLLDHGCPAPRIERLARSLFARLLADELIVHCDRAANEIQDAYLFPPATHEKTTAIPHGDFGDVYPNSTDGSTARDALGLREEDFVYVFFGSVKPYKNVNSLVSAFQLIPDEDARLVVAGNPETDSLGCRLTALSEQDDRVQLRLERIPEAEVQLYMNAADVVVLPFRTDPQTLLTSGSAVLAKQFGRPVVTPAVGCNPCMLACGGILYGENESLSAALRAARSADLRAMGEWNRQDLESITWSDIATQTASVYRSAVNGTSAG